MDQLKPLFNYLDAENINLDREEFNFQFNSHPDYPSLLALSDTLNFFSINNGAFKIDSSEINLLPKNFIANLKKGNSSFLSFIEKNENTVTYTNSTENRNSVSKDKFVELWDNVVLLAEKDTQLLKPQKTNWVKRCLYILTVILLISVLIVNQSNTWFNLFYVLPAIGVFLSLAVLKDLFSKKSELLDKFCNVTTSTSCQTVVNSNKWKIFRVINFSDLSIVFFFTQIFALFLMSLTNSIESYFYIQTILLVLALPIISISLYYQKYVEKKWCPICMTISVIILLELAYLIFLNINFDFNISLNGILMFLLTGSVLLTVWVSIKEILQNVKNLKQTEIKANRFKRNYSLFKNTLLNSKYYNLPHGNLEFGCPNATLKIEIVTSPSCGHCTSPHLMLKTFLEKYSEKIHVSFLYNVNPERTDLKILVKNMIQLKNEKGENCYNEAMDYYYKTRDDDKWLKRYGSNSDLKEIEIVLENQYPWFVDNDVNFTPCIFINGYKYPKQYEPSDLKFFINELMEDKSLLKRK